jgi:hypothetical protein
MKILRWRLSNWWLLALVLIAIISVPLLLFGLIIGGHIVGGIVGPPAIWNRPLAQPSRTEIVGSYHEVERHWQDGLTGPPATMRFNEDGTMTLANLPQSDGIKNCMLSASGAWRIAADGDSEIDLTVLKTEGSTTCKLEGLPYGISGILSIAGHWPPHSLYWVLGDPDSGEGIWFKRD